MVEHRIGDHGIRGRAAAMTGTAVHLAEQRVPDFTWPGEVRPGGARNVGHALRSTTADAGIVAGACTSAGPSAVVEMRSRLRRSDLGLIAAEIDMDASRRLPPQVSTRAGTPRREEDAQEKRRLVVKGRARAGASMRWSTEPTRSARDDGKAEEYPRGEDGVCENARRAERLAIACSPRAVVLRGCVAPKLTSRTGSSRASRQDNLIREGSGYAVSSW